MIYFYLYERGDINEFIIKSSEEIVKEEIIDDKILRNFEIKYNEFNIDINQVSNDIISFYGKEHNKNYNVYIKFF